MRLRDVFTTFVIVSALACSSYDNPTYPGGEDPGDSPGEPGGGPVGSVGVGSGIRFVSRHNGSVNPAVDTIAAGETVTWTWSGSLDHNVRSTGAPDFPSSPILTSGGTYARAFAVPGVYEYDCAVHGSAMRGRIVVASAAPGQ